MEAQGYDRDEIWRQTGWGRSSNGTWMFEIDDSGASLNSWDGRRPTTLGSILNHPELFAAYPNYKKMPVHPLPDSKIRNGTAGEYNALINRMGIDPTWMDQKTLEIILHEVNHASAAREGREKGTNINSAGNFTNYYNNPGEKESRNVEKRREYNKKQRRNIPPWHTSAGV